LDFYFAYVKIKHDKSHGHIKTMKNLYHQSKIFLWAQKVFNLAVIVFTFTILGNQFGTPDVFAAPTPTLSAAINNANVTINGNQVINSVNKTTEFSLRLTVNTNNRTGYTATISSESNNTALVNNSSALFAKIDSISTPSPLANLPNNTWGYRLASAPNYNPIPALAAPTSFRQTTEATNGASITDLNIGMKLASNLENGSYTNRLIFSVVTNPIDRRAVFKPGPEINQAIARVNSGSRANAFRRCTVTEGIKQQPHYNVADPVESDFGVYIWPDWSWGDKGICYGSDATKIYANPDSSYMFSSFTGIYSADFSNIDTSEVISMKGMFKDASYLNPIDVSRFDTRKVQDMSEMFSGIRSLMRRDTITLNLSNFNTSNVVNMKGMFKDSSRFTDINMSSFNTSKVTDMSEMFYGATSLPTINLSSFDFQNVTDMNGMFYQLRNLQTVVVSRFNTGKVTNFKNMFWNAAITSLNTAGFETQSAVNMSGMFYGTRIPNLDLSSFNTQNVTDMSGMFGETEYTVKLYLTNFDTRNVQDFTGMFSLGHYTRDSLTNIYVRSDFNTSSVTKRIYNVFGERRTLRGGNGSRCSFSGNNNEALKCLRIDRPGDPGYFTQI